MRSVFNASEHGEASGEERHRTTLAHFTVKVETILQCDYGAIERQEYRTTPVPFWRDNSDLVLRPTGSANFSVLYAKAMVTPTSPVGFPLDPVKAFAISSCSCTKPIQLSGFRLTRNLRLWSVCLPAPLTPFMSCNIARVLHSNRIATTGGTASA